MLLEYGFTTFPLITFVTTIVCALLDLRATRPIFSLRERAFFMVTSIAGSCFAVWLFYTESGTSWILTMVTFIVVETAIFTHLFATWRRLRR